MRRHGRTGSGAGSARRNARSESDPMSLIRTYNSETNPSRPVRPSPLTASQIRGMPLELVDRIRSFPLFQSTPDSFLAEILIHLRPQLHSPNDYILTEGDDAKAMYWLVRGAVTVASRDGESVYAQLEPGAFFGEIGILMNRPRTATIIARTRCLLLVLSKDDFKKILPSFPEVERAIRDEAQERLFITERKKKDSQNRTFRRLGTYRKRDRENYSGGLDVFDDNGQRQVYSKKRKSPSPGIADGSSALANGLVHVRKLLMELPLFSGLPPDILHFLGLNVQPRLYSPFEDIIQQGSQGREIYFIARGEVEVIDECTKRRDSHRGSNAGIQREVRVKARLKPGQYFGEVVSLSLAPRRTATVRTITSVECLMISGEVLSEFWERCPKDIRENVEKTAKKRLTAVDDHDTQMTDVNLIPAIQKLSPHDTPIYPTARRNSMPVLALSKTEFETTPSDESTETVSPFLPTDPDPFLSIDLDNLRSRSRRSSLAPVTPTNESPTVPSPTKARYDTSPLRNDVSVSYPQVSVSFASMKWSKEDKDNRGLHDSILVKIFQHLELCDLFRMRAVSRYWLNLLSKTPDLLHHLNLNPYNRKITDEVLVKSICPFIGNRPEVVDINNCFHISDEGFLALTNACGSNIKILRMRSVWDVTAPAILELANRAKGLREIDLSNCRKVSDTLLARIVGWVMPHGTYSPQQHLQQQQQAQARAIQNGKVVVRPFLQTSIQTAAGAVFGCPQLKRLTLSYCKHVTDRFMHHLAFHASSRIEEIDLTRCTTITDHGFQWWGSAQFSRLKRLCLADCTYLTDNAIVHLTSAAKGLQELDLVGLLSLVVTNLRLI